MKKALSAFRLSHGTDLSFVFFPFLHFLPDLYRPMATWRQEIKDQFLVTSHCLSPFLVKICAQAVEQEKVALNSELNELKASQGIQRQLDSSTQLALACYCWLLLEMKQVESLCP